RRREATVRTVLPTAGRVLRSTTLIRRGDVVTPDKADQLRSLGLAQRDRSGVSWVQTVLGRALLVLAALVPFLLFLRLLRPNIYGDTRTFVLVVLVLGSVVAAYAAAGIAGGETRFAVPVALAVVLLTIAFDSRVGSFATITLALLGGLVFGFDFEFLFATLIVGVLAVFSVRDVKSRSQLLASAGLIAVAYGVIVVGYALLRAEPFTDRFAGEALAAAASALLLLLAAPLLWGIERAFGVTTDLTLLELSDTNRPLLKELSVRAPGTFNHALQVANLAEAAADAIGANALRARVGALYHDIGKMLKPEYFVENQRPGENPHESLKPSMSALVIAAHVRDGVDLGRQNRLPTVVLDFIATHHGTSVMEYFFRKAEEQRGPEDTPVDPADYRYPGPRPFTNEQAIVMLADSVEAASRSLDRPTPRRLESLVETIVTSRIESGQLDTCALTFQDVARIKETFLAMLAGIYHFRVRYPGQAVETAEEPEPVAPADLREP
ncbi:MAG TPA: HDIG domain-containing protein, partial [Rubricoccaceae bacterium]